MFLRRELNQILSILLRHVVVSVISLCHRCHRRRRCRVDNGANSFLKPWLISRTVTVSGTRSPQLFVTVDKIKLKQVKSYR
jgi:hypothetical protein